jgi:hypothetical protein
MKRKERVEFQMKYLDVLNLLHSRIQKPTKISMLQFCKENRINTSVPKYLVELGYVKKVGVRTYQWVGDHPTLRLSNKLRKMHQEVIKKYKNPKTQNSVRIYKARSPKFVETTLLFGLITITSKIKY